MNLILWHVRRDGHDLGHPDWLSIGSSLRRPTRNNGASPGVVSLATHSSRSLLHPREGAVTGSLLDRSSRTRSQNHTLSLWLTRHPSRPWPQARRTSGSVLDTTEHRSQVCCGSTWAQSLCQTGPLVPTLQPPEMHSHAAVTRQKQKFSATTTNGRFGADSGQAAFGRWDQGRDRSSRDVS